MAVTENPAVLRAAHASGLHAVERELGELHRAMLRSSGEQRHAVRLSVLTLVVACVDEASATQAAVVAERIAARAPARVIIVVADRTERARIDADLSLQCSTISGREQVCAEVVRLSVGGETALHLGSVVTPLLLADVPMYLWLAGAPPLGQALHSSALQLCERLILDSSAYPDADATLSALAAATHGRDDNVRLADLAWARTTSWREQLARAFEPPEIRRFLRHVVNAEVGNAQTPPGGATEGRLMGGWLRSRLPHRLDEVRLSGADGPLAAVRMSCRDDGDVATVSMERVEDTVTTTVDVNGDSVLERSAPAELAALADVVGALIEQPGDGIYASALHHAAAIAGG